MTFSEKCAIVRRGFRLTWELDRHLFLSKLLKGASVDKTIELLEGNPCGPRPTSCTDQLTKALREAKSQVKAG